MTMGMRRDLRASYDEALVRLKETLQEEGFGILTEVDIQDTLQKKIGARMGRYRILGACNPPFAHEALQLDRGAGLMMPCNVALYEDEAGKTVVHAVDPLQIVAGQPHLAAVAERVRAKLARVLDRVEA